MTDPSGESAGEQVVGPLTGELAENTERQRAWVGGHLSPESAGLYEQSQHKLRLIQTILDNKWVGADETWKLQALGVALGDVVVAQSSSEWIQVSDSFGTDPALAVPGTSVLVFPLTMISKRIEAGESVDVARILKFVLDQIAANSLPTPSASAETD